MARTQAQVRPTRELLAAADTGHKVSVGDALRRWGWLSALIALVTVGGASLALETQPSEFRSSVTYVVPVDPFDPEAGFQDPAAAARLATTYSALLLQDEQFLAAVGGSVGLTSTEIQQGLEVQQFGSTGLLQITYTGSSVEEVSEVLGSLETLLPPGAVRNVPAGTLQLVRSPSGVAEVSDDAGRLLVVVGGLGIALGVVAAVSLERHRPRADRPTDLEALADVPVCDLVRLEPAGFLALLEAWQRASGLSAPSVALLGMGRSSRWTVPDAARELEALGRRANVAVSIQDLTDPDLPEGGDATLGVHRFPSLSTSGLTLRTGGSPGTSGAAERTAQLSDLTVLVVERSAPNASVLSVLSDLERFSVAPTWMIMVPRRSVFRRSAEPAVDVEPPAPTPQHEPAA